MTRNFLFINSTCYKHRFINTLICTLNCFYYETFDIESIHMSQAVRDEAEHQNMGIVHA